MQLVKRGTLIHWKGLDLNFRPILRSPAILSKMLPGCSLVGSHGFRSARKAPAEGPEIVATTVGLVLKENKSGSCLDGVSRETKRTPPPLP